MNIIRTLTASLFSFGILLFVSSCKNKDSSDEQILSLDRTTASYLLKYNVKDSVFVTQHVTSKAGLHLGRGNWERSYHTMVNFSVNTKQYILRHTGDGSGEWYIQEMYDSGDIGFVSDHGKWHNYYGTMVAMPKDGHLYIFRQNKENKHWYINEVTDDGTLLKSNDDGVWNQYYDTAVAFQTDDKSCFFAQTSKKGDDYHWTIQCVTQNGKLKKIDGGRWKHYWKSAAVVKTKKGNYIVFNRKVIRFDNPWKIVKINDNGSMGKETDFGRWEYYYPTLSSVNYDNKAYLIGGEGTSFFFHHIDEKGNLRAKSDDGDWARSYEYLLRFTLDPKYLNLSSWMGRLSETIGSRRLWEIVLPGSHDAGMNEKDRHDCYVPGAATTCNTITQSGDIAHQLKRGSRYFDIRPALEPDASGTEWSTAHATELISIMQGCQGEDRKSIVESLNDFFSDKEHQKELVILKISHCGTTPGNEAQECSKSQMNNIAKSLYNTLENVIKCEGCDIRAMTLDEILQKGNILLVFDGHIDSDTSKGIFKWGKSGDFYLYDHYSDSESFEMMKEDQIQKLLDDSHHSSKEGFLLSWTLTQTPSSAVKCPIGMAKSILDLATKANMKLYRELHYLHSSDQITKTLLPNVIYVDKFNGEATRIAIYLNEKYQELNP